MPGNFTQLLGQRLKERLNKDGYKVLYDHGDGKHRIVSYFKEYSRKYWLSFVDATIIRDHEVKIVCEIEESSSTPKKILGDFVSLMMAEKMRYEETDYSMDSPYIILGIYAKKKGVKRYQIENMLIRFGDIFNFDIKRIKLIFEEDLEQLIIAVEREIYDILGIAKIP